MNVTIMIFVIAISNNWTWGHGDNEHLYWCPNDNPSMYDDELFTVQSLYFDECFDCSSSDEAFAICQEHADFVIGEENRGFAMGWTTQNIWTTVLQLASGDFSEDDRRAVIEVWSSDCEAGDEKLCELVELGREVFAE